MLAYMYKYTIFLITKSLDSIANIISVKSLLTSIPNVMYAMTFFIMSRLRVVDFSTPNVLRRVRNSLTSPLRASMK